MVEFNPTHEVREGVDVVWQIPPNPKAVLFIAHSLNGTPFSYWPPHPNVPQLTGTPEHKVLIKDALERGYAVIVGKSIGEGWQTWPVPNEDSENFQKILKEWTSEHGLTDLPLSGLGSSNGGKFVSSLATVVKFHAIVVMIATGIPEAFEAAVHGEYPATLFVPMTGDAGTFSKVKQSLEILKAKGIPSAIQEAPPLKVGPHFLAEHIDELDEEQAAKLHSLFVEHGVVAEDNSLNKVVRKNDAEIYLRKAGILPTRDDSQRQEDEEKLNEAKNSKEEHVSKQEDGLHGPGEAAQGGRGGGRAGGGRGRARGGHGGGHRHEDKQPPSTEEPADDLHGHEEAPHGGRAGGGRAGGGRFGAGPPGGGRGHAGAGPPGGGRGRARGGPGGPLGPLAEDKPSGHPLAAAITNQLQVAQGFHTVTARHNKEIFAWLDGEGWINA